MILEVKRKHIRAAKRGAGSDGCPVALALMDATGSSYCFAGYSMLKSHQGDVKTYYKSTKVIAKFMRDFDVKRKSVLKPGRFRLTEISESDAIRIACGY